MSDIVERLVEAEKLTDDPVIEQALDDARTTIATLRKALECIASQKLKDELPFEEFLGADFEDGYDCCIKEARAALQGNSSNAPGHNK